MLTLATTSLDAVYLLVVPLVALFAGCNLLPHDRRIYGTLFSLPVRRSGFYAIHLAVLWVAIAVFFLVLFVVDLALLEVLPGAHAVPWRMLLHFQALGAAWALGFAYLGLLLGTVRRRGTALAVGLIVTILLVGVLPAAQLTANTLYAWRNFAEIERSLLEGTTPEPSLADRLQSWGQYLPGFVMAQALDSLSTRRFDDAEPAASCSTCAAAEPLARLLLRHYGSLLGYAGLLGVLGTAAFARKRESA